MLQALKIGDDKVEFIKDVKAKKYGNDAATCVRFVMQFRVVYLICRRYYWIFIARPL